MSLRLPRILSGIWFIDESRYKSLNPQASERIGAAVARFWENGSLRQHLGFIGWAMFRLGGLFWILAKVEGGIYKRLDEHREMTEFLEDCAPDILAQHPCLRNWLDSQDVFLCQLEKTLPVLDCAEQDCRLKPGGQSYQHMEFPRLPRRPDQRPPHPPSPYLERPEGSQRVSQDLPSDQEMAAAAASLWQTVSPLRRRGLIRWTLLRLDYVCWVFCRLEGGIFKRLDKHREMTVFLEERYPELLTRYPWLRRWLARQDLFLSLLERALPVRAFGDLPIRLRPGGYTYECVEYPRQTPSRSRSANAAEGGRA